MIYQVFHVADWESRKGPGISGRERAADLVDHIEKHGPWSLDYRWSSFEDIDVEHELATRKWPDDHLDKVRICLGISLLFSFLMNLIYCLCVGRWRMGRSTNGSPWSFWASQ
jgi:hypothetical protein